MSSASITGVFPSRAIEGGRITVLGEGFPVSRPQLPSLTIQQRAARVVFAASDRMSVIVPTGIAEAGAAPVEVRDAAGAPVCIEIATPVATGLHQVDNPVVDAAGNLYLTYSGTRGQEVPVSIFRVAPNGTREAFSSGVTNPTSMAFDSEGRLYVSSRFEGTIYRLGADGSPEVFANELGVACGLAFAPDGSLFVGDRSGTIFLVDHSGKATPFATLPSSVAAFHLALGLDGLYVTGPTLAPYDTVYRVTLDGEIETYSQAFGRPQGLAFGPDGFLYVVEALAGASGVYRVARDRDPELVLAGPALIGLAFEPKGGLIVCSNDTAYRLPHFP